MHRSLKVGAIRINGDYILGTDRIRVTFPSSQAFDCFEEGNIVETGPFPSDADPVRKLGRISFQGTTAYQQTGFVGCLGGVIVNGQLVTDPSKIRLISYTTNGNFPYDPDVWPALFDPDDDRVFSCGTNGNRFVFELDESLGATNYNTQFLTRKKRITMMNLESKLN